MAGDGELGAGVGRRRLPRCGGCGRVVRVAGVGEDGVLCAGCLEGALPFVGLVAEGDYRGALREYREGLGSGAADLEGLRFDPFDEEVRAVLGAIDVTLRGCEYTKGGDMAGRQRGASTRGGCSLALAFHNVRSAKGGNLELLEAELRRWGVAWDVVGLAETWLLVEELVSVVVIGGGTS